MFEEALENVLKTSKYDYLTERKIPIRERIFDFFLEILNKFFDRLNINASISAGSSSRAMESLFYILVILSILVVIYIVLRYYFKRKKRKLIFDDIFTEFKNNKLSFNQLIELSANCELDKNYKEALRYQYIALIMILANKNIIVIPDSMTGKQLIQKVSQNAPKLLDGVESTVNTSYLLYFGKKSITREFYESHKTKYDETIRRIETYEQEN